MIDIDMENFTPLFSLAGGLVLGISATLLLAGGRIAGISGILGGLLPDIFGPVAQTLGFSPYDTSYAASFFVMLGVFAFTKRAIIEPPLPKSQGALKQGFANGKIQITGIGWRGSQYI